MAIGHELGLQREALRRYANRRNGDGELRRVTTAQVEGDTLKHLKATLPMGAAHIIQNPDGSWNNALPGLDGPISAK